MKRYVLSLPGDTLYLRAQKAAAQAAADRLGVQLETVSAEMDPVAQGQQLLTLVQSRTSPKLDGILVEPVSAAGLPRVAEAAVAAGIAWVVSNAEVDYIATLRKSAKVPVFVVSQNHLEVGRIQGRQIGAILPNGGSVLYLRGPAMSWWATKRSEGLESTKPKNVEVKTLKVVGSTSESAYNTVGSWLSLSKARPESVQLIVSQNADFIDGAKTAFEKERRAREMAGPAARGRGSCGPEQAPGRSRTVVRGRGDILDDGQGDGNACEGDDGWFVAARTNARGCVFPPSGGRPREERRKLVVAKIATREEESKGEQSLASTGRTNFQRVR